MPISPVQINDLWDLCYWILKDEVGASPSLFATVPKAASPLQVVIASGAEQSVKLDTTDWRWRLDYRHNSYKGKCRLGKNVFIEMLVFTANDNNITAREFVEENAMGSTLLEGAAIATGVVGLAGVTIGEGAGVGWEALVSKEAPSYKGVVCIPARRVKNVKKEARAN